MARAQKAAEDASGTDVGSSSPDRLSGDGANGPSLGSETETGFQPMRHGDADANEEAPTAFEAVVGPDVEDTVVTSSLPSEQRATAGGSGGLQATGRAALDVPRRNTGAVRSAGSGVERTVWEPRRYPKWWLVAPSAVAVVGLVGWQMNGVRQRSEEDLEDRAGEALRERFPGARLRFHGRDGVISSISAKDRQAAHDLVRSIRGVRNVKEEVITGSSVTTPPTTAMTASPATTKAAGPATTAAPVTTKAAAPATTKAAAASAPSTRKVAEPVTTLTPEIDLEPSSTPPSSTTPTTSTPTTSTPTTPTTSTPTTSTPTTPTSSTPPAGSSTPAVAVAVGTAPQVPIEFASSNCELSAASTAGIAEVAQYLKANPSVRLRLTGHADSTGTTVMNLNYSACRADTVRSALIDSGIDGNRIAAIGRGSRVPIASNATADGRAKNRRVDLRYLGDPAISYTG